MGQPVRSQGDRGDDDGRRERGAERGPWVDQPQHSEDRNAPGEGGELEGRGQGGEGPGGGEGRQRAPPADDPQEPPPAPGGRGRRREVVGERHGERGEERAKTDQGGPPAPPPVGAADRLNHPVGGHEEEAEGEEAAGHQEHPRHLERMVAERPAGDPMEGPVGGGTEHGEERRLARVEADPAGRVGVGHRVDGVPTRFDDEVVDRKRTPFHEGPDGEPATAVVGREKGALEAPSLLDRGRDRLGVERRPASRFGVAGLGHGLCDEALLERDLVDARHGADPAEKAAEGHSEQDRRQVPPVARPGGGDDRAERAERGDPAAADVSGDPGQIDEAGEEPGEAVL